MLEMREKKTQEWTQHQSTRSSSILRRMETAWAYYAVLLFPILQYSGFTMLSTKGLLFVPVLGFVIVPFLDWLLGPLNTRIRRSDVEKKILERKWAFRIVMYIYAVSMLPLLWWSTKEALKADQDGKNGDYVGFAAGMAIVSSVGVNIAHELMHKTISSERFAGKFILSCVGNFYYFVEHTRGHHKMVGTPEDAATARYGESFYRYWPRMIGSSIMDAWDLEIERAKQNGMLSVWNRSNVILQSLAMTSWILVFLFLSLGTKAIIFFFWQAIGAWFLLDLINYVEHYGLVREKDSKGSYAPITENVSWDSSYPVSNIMYVSFQHFPIAHYITVLRILTTNLSDCMSRYAFRLFKVGLHSDHHLHAARRYNVLESMGPQHPAGLVTMALCALAPPLWYHVMNERVLEANKSALTVR